AGQLKARQEAEEALKERLQSLERLMTQLLEPIAEQDALIEQGMVNLVNHVARQVIQRELHMDSSHVRQVLREALKLLPMGAANIRIHVNPQDFERVKALRERHEESWRILEDDSLLPGGCRIETEHSRIDATIETRLAQAVKQLFEQQREQATHPLASDIRIDLDAPGDVDAP
ncbi:TPA: flagellar assembly protein FliH, partial [Pseudomonas aeruginosa]